MIRSFAFTTQGRLHTRDIDLFLMPTLLADTNLFLWVDLEAPRCRTVTAPRVSGDSYIGVVPRI